MADLTRILGTMLATGMAGRSRRGPAFSASPFGLGGSGVPSPTGMRGVSTDFRKLAGIGALGVLAYKAFQERRRDGAGRLGAHRPASDGGLFGGLLSSTLPIMRRSGARQPYG